MNIGIVYTGTTPQLIECLESELLRQIGHGPAIRSYADPAILERIRVAGGLVPDAAESLLSLYWQAVRDGADIVYNACSSVGEAAHSVKGLFALLGVSVVQIDEEMAMEAVCLSQKVAVIATLQTTLDPTRRLILRCAVAQGRDVEVDGFVVDAFGLEPQRFAEALCEAGRAAALGAGAIVLAQGSMAWCEGRVADAAGIPTLSSP
ncbi:MAG: aspartate/glutamate racemase family protein, partial [Clostridiales bacterium]|nr:aspartate/glutamate racemase family protein [Clostridiales bacterium]